MKLSTLISSINIKINSKETQLNSLKERKQTLEKLAEQFPEAYIQNAAVCLPNIWDKITCMRLGRYYQYYHSSYISARFLLGKKEQINNTKVYAHPYINNIAMINRKNSGSYRAGTNAEKEILVYDYEKMIPDNCPNKNVFVKRIRKYVVSIIARENLTILDGSFNKEDFERLILLK